MPKHDAKRFGRLRGCVQDRVDGDAQLLCRILSSRLRFDQFLAQMAGSVVDQFYEDFVLGFEMKVERPQTHVCLGSNVSDSRVVVTLARNYALGRFQKLDASFLASSFEPIRSGFAEVSRIFSHV